MSKGAVAVAVFLVSLAALAGVPAVRGSYAVPHDYINSIGGQFCVADLTGDGTDDAVMGFDGKLTITSELGEHEISTPGGIRAEVKCANIVGSPLPDAVCVRAGRFTIVTFTHDGMWKLIDTPLQIGTARSLLVGDVDKDGHIDAIAGSYDTGTYLVRAVDGEGAFEPPVQFHGPTITLAWLDQNLDEFPDIALGTAQGVAVRVNGGNGGFLPAAATASVPDNSVWGMWTGDFTGDGQANDIVVTSWSRYLAHFHVQPNGDVQKVTQQNMGMFLHRLAVFDADGDGKLDVCTSAYHSSKVLLAYDYEAGVGWSTAEFSTHAHPREVVPTFQTPDNGIVDALVLHNYGRFRSVSLTGFEACPLASPDEWEGSSFPLYLPAIKKWALRDSRATLEVVWEKLVEGRGMMAFIKPPPGEEPTCMLGAPQMSVDTCEVTASGSFGLGDLMSNVCGRHSRIVNEEANTVELIFAVEAHTTDTTPRELGDGSVIDHMTSFVSQLLVGFSFPHTVDTTWNELTLFNVPWVTALFKGAVPTENTGIMRATYELYTDPDTRPEITSVSHVLSAEISSVCEVHHAGDKEQCKFTLTVDAQVCMGTKEMELHFNVFCGDALCPNGHDTLIAKALIEQQENLCTEHLEQIEINAATEATEDVVVAGDRATASTTITGRDASGTSVAIVGGTLRGVKLCARADEPALAADPCSGAPYHIVVREGGQTHEGMEVFDVLMKTTPGEDGALLVEVSLVLSLDVIPDTWIGMHVYVVSTLAGFSIDGATRAVREQLLPHETTVVMRTTLSEDDGSGSRDHTAVAAGVGAAGSVLVVALAVVLIKKKKQRRASAAATAVQMVGPVQA